MFDEVINVTDTKCVMHNLKIGGSDIATKAFPISVQLKQFATVIITTSITYCDAWRKRLL